MRTALFILVIVLVMAIGFLLISTSGKPRWQVSTKITFLGFTNTVASAPATNAWFGFRETPQGTVIWEVIEISHKEGANWKKWDPQPNNSFAWQNPNPTNFTFAGIVPVETTNGPSRIVMKFTRQPEGKVAQFFAEVQRFLRRILHPRDKWQWRQPGPTAFVTNEFNIGAGTDAGRP